MQEIVFVRHFGDDKERVFYVPAGMIIRQGDLVLCDTRRGDAVGVATTDSCQKPAKEVLERLGATFPIRSIKQACGTALALHVVAEAARKMGEARTVCEAEMTKKNDELPF